MTTIHAKATSIVKEVEKATECSNTLGTRKEWNSRWNKPESGRYKINSDAALFSTKVGLGGVVRDDVGDVVVATCNPVEGTFDVEIAEAMAMRHALMITLEAGFRDLVVETDNMKLYTHMYKSIHEATAFGKITNDIMYLSKSCNSCVFSFVKRGGNSVAHELAKSCSNISNMLVWLEDYPQVIDKAVKMDLELLSK